MLLADATVRVQPGYGPHAGLVADDDEAAVATHANAATATTHVAVPCLGVLDEAGRYAFLGVGGGSVARHFEIL